ncbi:MAG: hypothetical protein GX383_03460 [Clostridium sp.]|nr:hypothetical protein [Bacillota bacterium]NLP13543.1 hypothetical protein [Clostridium sp.]NLV62729.1 hypothetical protein [Clostridiaceae bacterium]
MLELAKAIVKQYDKDDYWDKLKKNRKWADLKEKDLDVIKEAFKPFDNNRYQMKWFNNINQWYKNWNFNWNWQNCYDWYDKDYWEEWRKSYNKDKDDDDDDREDWENWYKWYDKDGWEDWNEWYKNKGNRNKNANKNKK